MNNINSCNHIIKSLKLLHSKYFKGFRYLNVLRKKKIIHFKDPHKIKQVVYIDDDKKPKKRLDGFLLLKDTKNDLPHEIIRANLSSIHNLINYIIRNEHY